MISPDCPSAGGLIAKMNEAAAKLPPAPRRRSIGQCLERTQREDGSWELRRPKLAANNRGYYTVAERTLGELENLGTSYEDAKESQDGALANWYERGRFQRDGKQWVIVQEGYFEYAVELELEPDGAVGEVVPLPPEHAYQLAKAADPPHVIQEG